MHTARNEITNPTRVKNFANFFKNYMSIWSVVLAALPVPITSLNLIPVFSFQKEILSTYTTLFCFLILGFIFYIRHALGKFFFPDFYLRKRLRARLEEVENNFNLGLINDKQKEIESNYEWLKQGGVKLFNQSRIMNFIPFLLIVFSIYFAFYYNYLIDQIIGSNIADREQALKRGLINSRSGTLLMASYLSIFLFAEAAFILMAIKEYLQDLLGIEDEELLLKRFDKPYLQTKD